jgi:hypothetical protein
MPAGSEPAEWQFRPRVVAVIATLMGASMFAVFAVIWVRMSEESRATFTTFQRLTLLFFGGVVLWLLYRMATVRLAAYADGVVVRNMFRTYRLGWDELEVVRFAPGDPWLQFFDAEGNRLGVLAVQASEGARAQIAAKQFAAVARRHRPH